MFIIRLRNKTVWPKVCIACRLIMRYLLSHIVNQNSSAPQTTCPVQSSGLWTPPLAPYPVPVFTSHHHTTPTPSPLQAHPTEFLLIYQRNAAEWQFRPDGWLCQRRGDKQAVDGSAAGPVKTSHRTLQPVARQLRATGFRRTAILCPCVPALGPNRSLHL